jgi:diadenosine tetraphosphate (Ap4A) HIT family hydrolase
MRIYATRRESEIILNSLFKQMAELPMDEIAEYNEIAQRIIRVNKTQCKSDHSKYKEEN